MFGLNYAALPSVAGIPRNGLGLKASPDLHGFGAHREAIALSLKSRHPRTINSLHCMSYLCEKTLPIIWNDLMTLASRCRNRRSRLDMHRAARLATKGMNSSLVPGGSNQA
jgi:hypothetical protein